MKALIFVVATAGLLLNLPANAATYKCVIDGRTEYQATPCNDDVKNRGVQSVISTPSKSEGSSRGGVVSAAENKRRDELIKTDLVPRARAAFEALKGGRSMAYREMLCSHSRQQLNRLGTRDLISEMANDLTKRNIEIDALKGSTNTSVSFTTMPNKTLAKTQSYQTVVNVHFGWDEGKPCVMGIDAI